MLRQSLRRPLPILLRTINTKENIGLTGIARNPNARHELLSMYTAFRDRLQMSSLPVEHPYRNTIDSYLSESVSILQSSEPDRLVKESGMQYEELIEEIVAERELMEAIEEDCKE